MTGPSQIVHETDQADQTDQAGFDEWCVLELMGRRRVAGRIREVQIAGYGFLRLDIPATAGHGEQTQFVAPGSVYALHPVGEQVARAVAARYRPEPVHRWELPPAQVLADNPDEDLDDQEVWGG